MKDRDNEAIGFTIRGSNEKRAGKYLLEASQAPPSDEIAYSSGDLVIYRLLAKLLKAGERESVIQFLERTAEIKVADRGRLLEAANAIRNGKAPFWYRSLVR